MTNLFPVKLIKNEHRVDSRLIADALGIQHKNFLINIKKYLPKIEEQFGGVLFQTLPLETKGGVQNISIAFLNEDQAFATMTLSRNTEKVVDVKLRLVKSFSKAKEALGVLSQPMSQSEMFLYSAQRMVDQERQMQAQAKEMQAIENRVLQIEAKTNVENELAKKIGKRATKLSKTFGYMTGKVPSKKYGSVKTYHFSILDSVFGEVMKV